MGNACVCKLMGEGKIAVLAHCQIHEIDSSLRSF
jgi:hypothetical protein